MTSLSIPTDDHDERPLDEVGFAGDLSMEERQFVVKQSQVEARVRTRRAEITAEITRANSAQGSPDADLIAKATEAVAADEVIIQELAEQIKPLRDEREAVERHVRQLLRDVGIRTAGEIVQAGCTGLFKLFSSIEAVREIRDNMGGSRIGLPCYVGVDRYCLIHQTIGGLQEGQEARHHDVVPAVSRDLTEAERGRVKVAENARRRRGPDRMSQAHEILQSYEESRRNGAPDGGTSVVSVIPTTALPVSPETFSHRDMADYFKCTEHSELTWSCRFCVAQAVVEGDLEPQCLVQGDGANSRLPGGAVDKELARLTASGIDAATVYVKAVAFKRKLARD